MIYVADVKSTQDYKKRRTKMSKMEEDVSKELDIDHNYISECWRREGEKNIIKKYFNARIIEEKAKLSGGYQYTHFLQQELDHLLEEMK
jgi:cystathionine beta-lyase family protein involved in aluminum resistance